MWTIGFTFRLDANQNEKENLHVHKLIIPCIWPFEATITSAPQYHGGALTFTVRQKPKALICPACGSKRVIRKGVIRRWLRTIPIGFRPTWICAIIQRVGCLACRAVRQVELGMAKARRSYTKAFERFALGLSRYMTIKDVAMVLGISWDVIKEIQKRSLKKRFAKVKLKHLKKIAIDEISIGKGHRYLTIVMDLKTGAVVFVGDGKGSEALIPFWQRLKASKAKVEAVAIDMSLAYITAVLGNLPNTAIVFDHFHVVRLVNDALAQLRRELFHEINDKNQRQIIKGTRWLLLKAPENLDNDRQEKQRLAKALELNQPLALAYYLKEETPTVYGGCQRKRPQPSISTIGSWRAARSGIPRMYKLAVSIAAHKSGILNYFDHRISTGPLEGLNNKIKTLKRQAYGFRDLEFFKLKILALHQTRYALIG